jgi:hypothetical protein
MPTRRSPASAGAIRRRRALRLRHRAAPTSSSAWPTSIASCATRPGSFANAPSAPPERPPRPPTASAPPTRSSATSRPTTASGRSWPTALTRSPTGSVATTAATIRASRSGAVRTARTASHEMRPSAARVLHREREHVTGPVHRVTVTMTRRAPACLCAALAASWWVTFNAGELIDTDAADAGEPTVTTSWPRVGFSVTLSAPLTFTPLCNRAPTKGRPAGRYRSSTVCPRGRGRRRDDP